MLHYQQRAEDDGLGGSGADADGHGIADPATADGAAVGPLTSPAGWSWGTGIARQGALTARTVAPARDVLAGRRSGIAAHLAFLGPAVIASIAYMDPGNFATNIQAGARYGYALLWVVLMANVVAMLFQALSAKLGIA